MKKEICVGLDVDSVLLDFMGMFCKIVKQEYGITYDPDQQKRFHIEIPGLSYEQITDLIYKAVASEEIEPLDYVPETVSLMHQTGMRLVVLTARDDRFYNITNKILREKVFKTVPFTLFFSKDKAAVAKVEKFDYFVEDRYKYAHDLASVVPQIYLLNQPWNQDRPLKRFNIDRVVYLFDAFLNIQTDLFITAGMH